jgi:hypothetical protein
MHDLSSKTDGRSTGHEIPCFFMEPKVSLRYHKIPLLDPILNRLNPVHALTPYSSNIEFNIVSPSVCRCPKWCLPFTFPIQNFVCITHVAPPHILGVDVKEKSTRMWNGLNWLNIQFIGGLLWTMVFHKRSKISWPSAYQGGLWSMEFLIQSNVHLSFRTFFHQSFELCNSNVDALVSFSKVCYEAHLVWKPTCCWEICYQSLYIGWAHFSG